MSPQLKNSFWDRKFFNIRFEYILLLLILFLTLFSKLYDIEARFPFGWDQARDAEMMWNIIHEGKLTLIGPQVVSDDAFFLGPLWYYMLAPFYFVFGMDPAGAATAVVVSALGTVAAVYFFFKKITGRLIAVISAILWATIPDVIAWNPMMVPIFEIAILFALLKIIDGHKKFIWIAFLLFGLSLQIHFQMIFLGIPLFIALYFCFRKKQKLPILETLGGIGLFLLTFAPLLIFDLRHDFINSKGFIELFGLAGGTSNAYFDYYYQLSMTLPKFMFSYFFLPAFPIAREFFGPITFLSSIIGIFLLSISRPKKLIFLSLIILPLLVFSFYKGRLSEYYFIVCSVPILLGLASYFAVIFRIPVIGKLLVAGFLILVTYFNIQPILVDKNLTSSLAYQRQAVKYLKEQKEDQIINVSFDMPVNSDGGFKYLFKVYGLKPENRPEGHLWTIAIPAHLKKEQFKAVYGDIGVIRR